MALEYFAEAAGHGTVTLPASITPCRNPGSYSFMGVRSLARVNAMPSSSASQPEPNHDESPVASVVATVGDTDG
eukprot:5899012-Lingulodinium_polyedra.AAC.1